MMNVVFACLWSCGCIIPFDFMHYISAKKLSKGKDDEAFSSKPKLAFNLIREGIEVLKQMGINLGYIIFDSVYSASHLLDELSKLNLKYFAGLKSNRIVVTRDGKKVGSVMSLVTGLTPRPFSIKI